MLVYRGVSPRITAFACTHFYYFTIAPFYHIWLKKRAKYEPVMHCSVPVWPVYNRANTDRTEQSNEMAEPNQPNFDLFTSLDFTFNILLKATTFWPEQIL